MIQIDMEMPEKCSECEFEYGLYGQDGLIHGCYIQGIGETDAVRKNGRLPSCPLIDVPENNVGNSSEIPNSSTDCISRQAAVDAITERADRCAENFSTDDPFWEGLMIAKSIVKGLPPVQVATPVRPERKESDWIPFKQEQNPETGRWELVDPPEDRQHILITVNLPGHEPVQDDYWYWDVYGYLDSGYRVCDEAIAWRPLPEPWEGEQE